ncbi:hypothetical protein AB1N83_009843 [Pleurotus pulmonarius]
MLASAIYNTNCKAWTDFRYFPCIVLGIHGLPQAGCSSRLYGFLECFSLDIRDCTQLPLFNFWSGLKTEDRTGKDMEAESKVRLLTLEKSSELPESTQLKWTTLDRPWKYC